MVLEVAGKAVAASGVDPDGYASQIASPEFRKAMKDLGWRPAPHNPAKWGARRAEQGPNGGGDAAAEGQHEAGGSGEEARSAAAARADAGLKRVADLSKTRAPMIERLQKQGVVIRVVKDRRKPPPCWGRRWRTIAVR